MKKSLLTILFLLCVQSVTWAQDASGERISLKGGRMTLSDLVRTIEKSSRVRVTCDEDAIDMGRMLDIPQSSGTVSDVLKAVFADSGIEASFAGDHVVLTDREKSRSYLQLAGKSYSGKVIDENGEPLPGAAVKLEGSTRATIANTDGEFSIKLLPGSKLLSVSYIGQEDKSVIINPDHLSDNTITLPSANNELDATVVIGYGTQKKRDITGAITSITAKEIDKSVGGSIETSLQGKIPGLEIVQNSGEPGTSSTITLRGASSINGTSEPLYIIDGVMMDSDNIKSIQGDASFNPMAGINVSDIESIEVLKDAASAAIYGSRAANGVIIITTKGGGEVGHIQKPTVKLSHNSSLAIISHYLDVMNSHDFREAYVDARNNANLSIDRPWVINPSHPYYANSTNWQKLLFKPTWQSKTDVSMNGSSEKSSYGISIGYLDNDPILLGTKYRQASVRANFGYRISGRIIGGTNFNYSRTKYVRVMSGQTNMSSAIRSVISAPPVFSPYDYETGEIINMLGSNEFRNPLALVTKYPITFEQDQMVFSQFFKINLTKWLDYRIKGYYRQHGMTQSSYFPKEYDSNHVDTSRSSDGKRSAFTIENTLEFHKKISSHTFTGVAGQSYQFNSSSTINLVGRDYMDESQILIQNASLISTAQQLIEESALLSYFARAGYNYKSRYIIQATVRADGSSRFGSNNRFGIFPSVSAGWRFSDERFMLFAREVLSDGKLRISAGMTGNQKLGNYVWQGIYSTSTSNYDGSVSILNTALSNRNLSWERTIQYNSGLDLSFFRGRITATADLYIKDTDRLLFNAPLPSFTGFGSRTSNFGSIRNSGFELALSSINISKQDFQWSTNFNMAMNRNRITALANGEDVIYTTRGIYALCRVGEPVGLFYGWRAKGVYASDSDNVWTDPATGATRPVKKGSAEGEAFKGGDMIWDDINNDGIINDDDRVVIGDPHPKMTGGFGTSLSWKNWTLSAFFSFCYGNDIINSQRRLRNKMAQMMNLGTDALDRWRQAGDVTDFPKLTYGDAMDNFRPSTFTIEDGSYVRFKDLSISYSLPKQLCSKIKMKSLAVSATASNLLLWTRYSGFDPEVNTSDTAVITGLDDGAFPKTRVFGISINATF